MSKKTKKIRFITKKDLEQIEKETEEKVAFYNKLPEYQRTKMEEFYDSVPLEHAKAIVEEAYRMAYEESDESEDEGGPTKEGGEDTAKETEDDTAKEADNEDNDEDDDDE